MRLFEVQKDLTSYTYPVVKIIISLSVIVLSLLRNRIFQFSNSLVNVTVTLFCFILTIASILCLYISVGEVFHTSTNRKNANYQSSEIRPVTIGVISKIVSENDIVEIEACKNNKIIKIGASADCEYSSSVFKDKLFYISGSEYKTVELFAEALLELFPDGIVPVLKIDDLAFG